MNLASWTVIGVIVIAAIGSLIYIKKHPSKCSGVCSGCAKEGSCKSKR